MNNAAVNMGAQILPGILISFSLDIYPVVGFLDHVITLFLMSSIMAKPIYIPTIHVQGFPFSTHLSKFVITFFFRIDSLTGVQ
jgi:hypothetical protein